MAAAGSFLNPTFSFALACVFSYPRQALQSLFLSAYPCVNTQSPFGLSFHFFSLFLTLLFLFYCTYYHQCVSHCSYSSSFAPFGSASILLFLKLRAMMQLLGYDADIHHIICAAPQAKGVFHKYLHLKPECILWGQRVDIIYLH